MGCFHSKNDDEKKSECVICFEKTQLLTFAPCGHTVICQRCTDRIAENPRFLQYIKVYNRAIVQCVICRSRGVVMKIYK